MPSLPPDVLFAQKASAVSKCAGMDPRTMDLEKFRVMAPVIFARAYSAIYKESLGSASFATGEDSIDGAQIVIERLLDKTNVSALQNITGHDVCAGSHRAIGVLVGVLFAEGQRMWLAKQEEKRRVIATDTPGAQPSSPLASSSSSTGKVRSEGAAGVSAHLLQDDDDVDGPQIQSQQQPKKTRKVKKKTGKKAQRAATAVAEARAAAQNPQVASDNYEDDGDFEDYSEPDNGPLSALIINQPDLTIEDTANPSPKEVQKLVNRIQYLEQQLRKQAEERTDISSSRGKIRRVKKKESPIAVATRSNATIEDNDSGFPRVQLPQPALPRAVRPSSAPSVGRPRPPQRRIYAAEGQDAGALELSSTSPRDREPATNNDNGAPLNLPASWYTYDMASGRRILLSAAEREAIILRKKKDAQGNVKSISEMPAFKPEGHAAIAAALAAAHPRHEAPPPRPTNAEWPGESTGRSTEDWVKKQREAREGQGKKSQAMLAAIAEFSKPRYFASYNKMEKLDLLVSVEHCHSCELHNVTLRHKPGEYVKIADGILRSLAQLMHECNLGARVGVTRFNTHISSKGSHTDADSRIGAFEIQIAFKSSTGIVTHELLHSKLATTRWPSKNVVEKRLRAFLSKVNIPTYYKRPDAGDYSDFATAGLGTYPIGMGSFEGTPVGEKGWIFPLIPPPLVIQSPTNSHLHSHGQHKHNHHQHDQEDGPLSGLTTVQWVFDARHVVVAPLFDVGTTVYVTDITSKASSERHPLLGVVKSVPIDPTGSMRVRLKYHAQESTILETQCINLADHIPDDEGVTADSVPLHLCVLLLLAGAIQTGKELHILPVIAKRSPIVFRVNESDDYKDDEGIVHLGRTSLFHQLRALAASVEARCKNSDSEDHLLTHANFDSPVDLQLSYGESTLNWIQGRFGQVVSIIDLQKAMVEHALSSSSTTTPRPAPTAADSGVVILSSPLPSVTQPVATATALTPVKKEEPALPHKQAISAAHPKVSIDSAAAAAVVTMMMEKVEKGRSAEGESAGPDFVVEQEPDAALEREPTPAAAVRVDNEGEGESGVEDDDNEGDEDEAYGENFDDDDD